MRMGIGWKNNNEFHCKHVKCYYYCVCFMLWISRDTKYESEKLGECREKINNKKKYHGLSERNHVISAAVALTFVEISS